MDKIKVLHIIPSFASGGAERVLLGYMKDFANNNEIELHTLALGENHGSIFDEEISNLDLDIKYAGIDRQNRGSSILRMRAIRKAVKELKPDIIHSHLRVLPYVTLATLFNRRIKRVHTIHTVPQIASAGKMMLFDKFCFKYMKVLPICLNRKLAGCAEKLYEIPFCEFLYNGINISSYKDFEDKDDLRNSFGIPKDAYVVGHVGRFVPIKNHAFLIDVFYEVKKQRENSWLLLVGEGPEMDKIKDKCTALGIDERVVFAGPRTDVNYILQIMDGYIFPSIKEGLGISLIEAQAAGLKCVVSDTVPEEAYVSDELVALSLETSPKEWSTKLLSDSKTEDARNNLEDFSIDKVNEKLSSIYRKM